MAREIFNTEPVGDVPLGSFWTIEKDDDGNAVCTVIKTQHVYILSPIEFEGTFRVVC